MDTRGAMNENKTGETTSRTSTTSNTSSTSTQNHNKRPWIPDTAQINLQETTTGTRICPPFTTTTVKDPVEENSGTPKMFLRHHTHETQRPTPRKRMHTKDTQRIWSGQRCHQGRQSNPSKLHAGIWKTNAPESENELHSGKGTPNEHSSNDPSDSLSRDGATRTITTTRAKKPTTRVGMPHASSGGTATSQRVTNLRI